MSRSGEIVLPRDFAASCGVLNAISLPLSLAGPDLEIQGVHQLVDGTKGQSPLPFHELAQRGLIDPRQGRDGVTAHTAFTDRAPQLLREWLAHVRIIPRCLALCLAWS